MKLVVNQTKKESFLFDNDKIVNPRVAYSLINNYKKNWNFANDNIHMRDYTKIDSFIDRITGKKHLSF